MDAQDDAAPAVLFTLRFPARDRAELVITENRDHSCKVYSLTFSQLRLLCAQSADAVAAWPV